ncbi:LacI family DNA-binding transcriptional regulator [Paenibacillus silviterrae]|uniref:LacI family DNA-binding transcriptional regulator n=1 Tax=Paenibacillus silviterrae TaxID=3242194 RepID=UPI002543E8BE|nr:LacI family DNA-binding transcriptional regulator [Paenibacillus chinjuensis]
MPRRKSVTLQHLAEELGLTIQTVSKALRGHSGMSEETRQLILQTASRLGYRTKEQLRQLESDRISPYPLYQRRFLLVLSEQSVAFNRLLLQGLHERFAEFGHRIDTLLLPAKLKAADYEEWLEEHGVLYCDGIFIAPRITPDQMEERLLALPLPRILLNFPPPGAKVDSVVWDVYEAMYLAVRELVKAGHRNILYCGDILSQRGYVLRWQAFQEAMKEHRLTVKKEEHAVHVRGAGSPWLEQFERQWLKRRPTAVICGIDEEVAPVYYRIQAFAKVPDECSLIGFVNEQSDCLPLLDRPALLIRETGYRAADRMLWRIANPQRPYEHIRIQGEYVTGNTVIRKPSSEIRNKLSENHHIS